MLRDNPVETKAEYKVTMWGSLLYVIVSVPILIFVAVLMRPVLTRGEWTQYTPFLFGGLVVAGGAVFALIALFRGVRRVAIVGSDIEIDYPFARFRYRFNEITNLSLQTVSQQLRYEKLTWYRIAFTAPDGRKQYLLLSGEQGRQVYEQLKSLQI